MKLVTAIFNLFKKRGNAPSRDDQRWADGYDNFEKGKELYLERKLQEAVDYFDQSIELNFGEEGIYGLRGSCLQLLKFDLDAIDDFTKAIASEPNDCNLYYARSLSRGATGDLQGQVSDLQEAIRVATVHSAHNKVYDEYAREMGWTCVVDKFRMDLICANFDLETQAQDERRQREHPDVSLPPDLATRRRAQSQRRTTL
jgi:tetratricopeptide (TPR) repeat protein